MELLKEWSLENIILDLGKAEGIVRKDQTIPKRKSS